MRQWGRSVPQATTKSGLLFCVAAVIVAAVFDSPMAQSTEKPRVALRAPIVSEAVPKAVRHHLDLPELVAQIERSILATRKFEVLTRDSAKLGAIVEEQKFAKSPLSKGNAAESGALEAAHYLILPTVHRFEFLRSVRPVPNISDKYLRKDSGRLELEAQIVDTSTGKIKFSQTVSATFATKDEVVNTKGGAPSGTHFTRMSQHVAAQLADHLVDKVFPMVVVQIDGELVYINRGQDGGLSAGSVLNVYRPGEGLIDPYTKEVLGTAERLIGKVKVTRVNPNFSLAEIVKGSLTEPIASHDILRKP